MNLDNNSDYFLHDFEGDTSEKVTPDEEPKPVTAGDSVDFTSEASSSPAPAPRRGSGCLKVAVWTLVIAFVAAVVVIYVRYLTPHTTDSQITGYVTRVERRGLIFKTFEGEMISRTALADSSMTYARHEEFSIPSDSLAHLLQAYQGSGLPVTVTLEKYYGSLPWRGEKTTVLVGVRQ